MLGVVCALNLKCLASPFSTGFELTFAFISESKAASGKCLGFAFKSRGHYHLNFSLLVALGFADYGTKQVAVSLVEEVAVAQSNAMISETCRSASICLPDLYSSIKCFLGF